MYDSEFYLKTKSTLETCPSIERLFALLPAGCEIAVSLDNRVPCTLICQNHRVELLPQKSERADIEVTLFSESIRRLSEMPPQDLMALSKEFTTLSVAGHAKFKLLCSPKDLYDRGYFNVIQRLAPDLQGEFSKYAFMAMQQASKTIDAVKAILKR